MDYPLPSITAAPGLSIVTPIVLYKFDSIYSSGTTIAVSSFIAYASTRGQVRLIDRSNGSCSLLRLPSPFAPEICVMDMVVSTTPSATSYLACVTSDGGLAVWEVPSELCDQQSAKVVVHVASPPPTQSQAPHALRLVRWHPRILGLDVAEAAGTVAVASDCEVYVFNVSDALKRFRGKEITLSSLATIANVISIPSPLVGFTFDFNPHATTNAAALVTLSVDSTIMVWSMSDFSLLWTGRVLGEGLPCSIDILDGGWLIGRKQGTILQLLPSMSASVTATIRLAAPLSSKDGLSGDEGQEPTSLVMNEERFFARVKYDPGIRTIWVVHSGRPSLFAIRLRFHSVPAAVTREESPSSRPPPTMIVPMVDQILASQIPMQCLHMVILPSYPYTPGGTTVFGAVPLISSYNLAASGNNSVPLTDGPDLLRGRDEYADENGSRRMAFVSFVMHQGGVDRIGISMNAFEQALRTVHSKLPLTTYDPDGQGHYPIQTGSGVITHFNQASDPTVFPAAVVTSKITIPVESSSPRLSQLQPNVGKRRTISGAVARFKLASGLTTFDAAAVTSKVPFPVGESSLYPPKLQPDVSKRRVVSGAVARFKQAFGLTTFPAVAVPSNVNFPVEASSLRPSQLQPDVRQRRYRQADNSWTPKLKARADAPEQHSDLQQGYIRINQDESSDDSEDTSDGKGDPEQIHARISSLLRNVEIDFSGMRPPRWEGAHEMSHKIHSHLESCTAGSRECVETLKLLQDLCSLSGLLPSCYEVQHVTFDRSEIIGRGGEAIVYHGRLNGMPIVAREVVLSKAEWVSQAGRKVVQLVHREAITHSQLHHPNVLAFLGIFHEAIGSPPIMVLPYIEKGSVSDLIINQSEPILVFHFARIITGIASGVAYLHSRNPPIVHGDIHPGNVLLDASYKPFLCDFGLSRISHEVTRTRTMLHEGGRTRFLAPELLAGTTTRFRTTQSSDTFSLSMTFLNIWSRQHPFVEIRREQKVAASLRRGQRPKRPTGVIDLTPDVEERFWTLLVEMWAHDPQIRPSSEMVRDALEGILGPWVA